MEETSELPEVYALASLEGLKREARELPEVFALASLELFKPYTHKIPEDIILGDHFNKALRGVENLRQLQKRIENLWRLIAFKCYGWVGFHDFDLMHPKRRIVVQLNKMDRGTSVRENTFKLLAFRNTHARYDLFFLDIDRRCTVEELKEYRDCGAKCLSGEHALELLFGEDAQKIADTIQYVALKLIKKNETDFKDFLPNEE